MNIGEKIKAARKSLGLSQQQLGGTDFTKGYISRIEKGHVNPSMKVLSVISDRLKKPISYFLEEDNIGSKELQKKFITGENFYLQKEYNQAMKVFYDIVNLHDDTRNSIYCTSLLYIGKCFFYLNNYLESIGILKKALKHIKEISLYEDLIYCYCYIGHCYFNLTDYKEAIHVYTSALNSIESKKLNMPSTKAKLLLNIGTANSNIGRVKIAMEYFTKNISYCQKNYLADTLLDCYIRVGYCAYKLGMYNTSKEFVSKGISMNKSLNCSVANIELFSLLGLVVAKEGKIDSGLDLLSKSMNIAKNINYEFGYNINIAYKASVLLTAGELNECETFALDHLATLENAENKMPLYLLQGHLGDLYIQKGNIEKGKKYLETAIKNYISISLNWEVSYYSKLLADTLIEINPKEARDYYNLSIEYTAKTV
ncbi:helix-turn-helix transcriptional regulator [Oceanirhabdus sp. W0125-5]|uniref:helix-turn-helix transcriptional regulator n=1 Tax=Oceanirhabdus sp. W0125-5 TaxID=2999116 RepID=UPI0022F2EB59|nr:helix-turn-helix transcriptional regulator [Oceanirhabdus sp. W0125-5]WBW97137.1 helix-turn-helix transcriptional regulator [Oceanirhabdus sp. W0125-5]